MKTLQPKPTIKSGFYFDAKEHNYYLDGKPLTGCTTILGVLAKPALIQWAANQAAGASFNASVQPEALEEFRKLSPSNLDFSTEVCRELDKFSFFKEARTAHAKKRDKAAEQGTDLHALVEEYVKDCIQLNSGNAISNWGMAEEKYEPIKKFILWSIHNSITFIASEQKLYSKELWVAGTADLVFEMDGKRFIGDVKTYKKIWDRVPFFQCAGYALMWEEAHKNAPAINPDPIDGYCVLRVGKDGTFDEVWSYDVEGDTKAFKACVELYRALANFKR